MSAMLSERRHETPFVPSRGPLGPEATDALLCDHAMMAVLRDRLQPGEELVHECYDEFIPRLFENASRFHTYQQATDETYIFIMHALRYHWSQWTPREAIHNRRESSMAVYFDADLYMVKGNNKDADVSKLKPVAREKNMKITIPIFVGSRMCPSQLGHITHAVDARLTSLFISGSGKLRYTTGIRTEMNNMMFPKRYGRFSSALGMEIRAEVVKNDASTRFRATSTLFMFLTSPKQKKNVSKGNRLMIWYSYLKNSADKKDTPVAFVIFMMALGVPREETVRRLRENVFYRPEFERYVERVRWMYPEIDTEDKAWAFLARLYHGDDFTERHIISTKNSVHTCLLSNMNERPVADKVEALFYMAGKVMDYAHFQGKDGGAVPPYDRDAYDNITIDDGTSAYMTLIRRIIVSEARLSFVHAAMLNLRRTLHNQRKNDSSKKVLSMVSLMNPARVSQHLSSAVATGKFSKKINNATKPVQQTTCNGITSSLAKIGSRFSKQGSGEHWGPREVHPTSFGYTCTCTTRDGEDCGLIGELAQLAGVSHGSDCIDLLLEDIEVRPLVDSTRAAKRKSSGVDAPEQSKRRKQGPEGRSGKQEMLSEDEDEKVNNAYENEDEDEVPQKWRVRPFQTRLFDHRGRCLGFVRNAQVVVDWVRDMRRTQMIGRHTSVGVLHNGLEVHVRSARGALFRYLLVAKHLGRMRQMPLITMEELFKYGVLECMTAFEEHNCDVVLREGVSDPAVVTHVELGDASFLSTLAASLVGTNQNQGPRLTYMTLMGLQAAVGQVPASFGSGKVLRLVYPQRPMTTTKSAEWSDSVANDAQNVIVGVTGSAEFAQEDGTEMSLHFAQMAGMATTVDVPYTVVLDTSKDERFEKPDPAVTSGMQAAQYDHLMSNGLPRVGTVLGEHFIVIGCTSKRSRVESGRSRHDRSLEVKRDNVGSRVVSVQITATTARVLVVKLNFLEVGMKVSDMYAGQKMVLSMLKRREDMCFVPPSRDFPDGLSIDMCFGPTGFPSRMTYGWFKNLAMGSARCHGLGNGVDDQVMVSGEDDLTLEETLARMKEHGFEEFCRTPLVDGTTGDYFRTSDGGIAMFTVGIMPMNVLHHMARFKHHVRGRTGPVTHMRQPTDGRANKGGLRFGSMEVETLLSVGVPNMLRRTLHEESDAYEIFVCSACGVQAIGNMVTGYRHCRLCNQPDHVVLLDITYALYIFMRDLGCVNFTTKFRVEPIEDGVATLADNEQDDDRGENANDAQASASIPM